MYSGSCALVLVGQKHNKMWEHSLCPTNTSY